MRSRDLYPHDGSRRRESGSPERRGRALATVTGGLTIAFAFGIPLGTLVGDYFGWRTAFVLVGVLGAVVLIGIAALLPTIENPLPVSLRERLGVVQQPAIVAALSLTAIRLGAGFVVFTYISTSNLTLKLHSS